MESDLAFGHQSSASDLGMIATTPYWRWRHRFDLRLKPTPGSDVRLSSLSEQLDLAGVGVLSLRRRRVAPITASTVSDSRAVRGTKIRWVFDRRSGGLIRKPSAVVRLRSFGIMPSSTSLSLNLRRTHSPSVRGRVVKVLRLSESESLNSRTKYTALMSRRSIATTLPGGIQQLEFALADEIGGRNVAVDRIPVHLSDHDFLVG